MIKFSYMTNELIKNVYLFKGLPTEEIAEIAKLTKFSKHQAGEAIFSQGETAKAMYVVKYGSVKVRQATTSGDTVDVAVLGSGSHFGEMSFIDGEKRTATVEAVEVSEILVIEYKGLTQLLESNHKIAAHFYKSLAKFLSGRLALTTKDLSFSREKIRKQG